MGSSSLVPAEVTSPPDSSQQTAVSSSYEQQQQTRVLGQYSHHQDCEHHRGQRGGGAPAAAAAGSEESAVERGADPGQGHQPQVQGGTLQVPESQQESLLPALLLLLPAQVQSDLLAPPLLAPDAEGRVQGGEQQQQP